MHNPSSDSEELKRRTHWERVWSRNRPDEMGWFQATPEVSLELIDTTGIGRNSRIMDVGGGTSTLVDRLLDRGFTNVSVLEISESAIDLAKARLGERSSLVNWVSTDVTVYRADKPIDLWHDRAVLHFLTEREDRVRYVQSLAGSLAPRGHVVIATFARDGPRKCAGLKVVRYGSREIMALLGDEFELLEIVRETHVTPGKTKQRFSYFRLQKQE